ncbi:putative formate dehydrogenase oxidoreductase protein [Lentisphaera araneosa HTCC2155]|uniref:Putative formate dehydrogenase oxidoreductase protein n=1 Tax=Lentisphaera araneosa HTCC2155 TaxID=313628 RepID=A6DQ64_9BACT|nr:FdhF/YdeP family oxidoreductase [Lentisphaera araneosa]EDM26305.1 putative formate dehydrogenase oxidoreductase protein [Lentisphaera araneosa HTCC2155]
MSKEYAGGWGALKSSMKFMQREAFAKSAKTLFKMNQPKGFDCPGCAWPDPKETSMSEFCENGVKALTYETTKKRASSATFMNHTVTEMQSWSDFKLEDQGRLTEPFVYNDLSDKYEPISWDDAFAIIAKELKALDNPDEALFYTSGRTSNEAAFLYQLMGRMYGTNNFPDCSNLCHESTGVGMGESVGIGKGTVLLDDFEKADAIYVFGQNPGTNHPRMLAELQTAAKRGCKILSFNPLVEAGLKGFIHPQDPVGMGLNKVSPISSHYYQPLIGGDLAAIRGMIKHLFESGVKLDEAFIEEHCSGFDEYKALVESVSWEEILRESGLPKAQIIEAAEVYANSDRVIACWAMGLTQHRHGVANIQEVINLLLLKGNIGREGAGACPVRGHSNVQGDRTVGITEFPKEDFLVKLEQEFDFTAPRKHGLSAVHAIEAMEKGEAKVFVGMGGNFASATPDTEKTFKAMQSCELTVHVSTHLNRSHVIHGKKALILPCIGRSEKDLQASGLQSVTVEDSMSMVHASTGSNEPASTSLKSEPAIVAGISKALFGSEKVDWDGLIANYANIRNKIEAVIPGFDQYNKKIQVPGGFHLRNSARLREWKTATDKARFISNELPAHNLEEGQLRLMTMRSHDQYNTTIYGMDDRYRGIKNERKVIFLNETDMKNFGLTESDSVRITSYASDGVQRSVEGFRPVKYDIPQNCAGAYFPETNPLVGLSDHAKRSFTPMSKFIVVRLEKL